MKHLHTPSLLIASLLLVTLLGSCNENPGTPTTTSPNTTSPTPSDEVTVSAPVTTRRYTREQSIRDANPNTPIDFLPSNEGFHEGHLLADTDQLMAENGWVTLNDYLEITWCAMGEPADYAPLLDGDPSTVYTHAEGDFYFYELKFAAKDNRSLEIHGMIVTWRDQTHDTLESYKLGDAYDCAATLFLDDYYVPQIGKRVEDSDFLTIPVTKINFELDWDMIIELSGKEEFPLSISMYECSNPVVDVVFYGKIN